MVTSSLRENKINVLSDRFKKAWVAEKHKCVHLFKEYSLKF